MTLYVKEYEWMWNDLQLTLAECRVYAYIHGLTHGAKGGYDGSKRKLAELLGLNAGATKRVLDALTEKHLIVHTENVWKSVATNNTEGVATNNESVVTDNESVASNNSPHTPLYNININDEKDMKPDQDFLKFKDSYINAALNWHDGCYNGREGAENWFKYRGVLCEEKWADMKEPKKQAILEELKKPDGFWRSRPDFLLADFPEPQPEWKTGGESGEDLVQVRYNGHYKICTRDTMKLFGLEWVRDW